jgi:hypothetical protein
MNKVKSEPAPTGDLQADTRFKPGVSGNPAGRKAGSRNRLSQAFFDALEDSFEREGEAVINRLIKDDPKTYCKIIAQLCPAKLEGVIDHRHHLGFDDANSIGEVLELVAQEVGVGKALMLADLLEVEAPDFAAEMQAALPPPTAPINPYERDTAKWRSWNRANKDRFAG